MAVAATVVLAGTAVPAETAPVCHNDMAIFRQGSGAIGVVVEIADTEAERAEGLMYRRTLARNAGMLFIYDTPRPVSFWMRDTYLPLDMIFMDRTGTVRHIHRNATPLDPTPISGAAAGDPEPERLMVLEVLAGEADRLGLRAGQAMAHPALPHHTAAWPCAPQQ